MKSLFLALGAFALLASCGSDDAPSSPAQATTVADEVAQEVSANAKMPDVGDYQAVGYADNIQVNGVGCAFHITEHAAVTALTDTNIEITFDRSVTPAKNPESCPAEPPSFQAHEVSNWSIADYRELQKNSVKSDLDLSSWQNSNSSATIAVSQEIKYQGLRSQQVDIAIQFKSGQLVTKRVFVSLDSLFLANFSSSFFNQDGKAIIFRSLNQYSIKKLNNPH